VRKGSEGDIEEEANSEELLDNLLGEDTRVLLVVYLPNLLYASLNFYEREMLLISALAPPKVKRNRERRSHGSTRGRATHKPRPNLTKINKN